MNASMVIIMVMTLPDEVVDFMRNAESGLSGRVPPALHRKAMQRQQHKQKETEQSAHGSIRDLTLMGVDARIIASGFPSQNDRNIVMHFFRRFTCLAVRPTQEDHAGKA